MKLQTVLKRASVGIGIKGIDFSSTSISSAAILAFKSDPAHILPPWLGEVKVGHLAVGCVLPCCSASCKFLWKLLRHFQHPRVG